MNTLSNPKVWHLSRTMFSGETLSARSEHDPSNLTELKVRRGCAVAAKLLEGVEDPEVQGYLNRTITPALLGSAWRSAFHHRYADAPNNNMYRILSLPRFDLIKDSEGLAEKTWEIGVGETKVASDPEAMHTAFAKIDKKIVPKTKRYERYLSMGHAAIWLGATPIARGIESGALQFPETHQYDVRDTVFNTVKQTFELGHKIGSLPTVKQLVDPYSDLVVEIMRDGPASVREAHQSAIEDLSQPSA